MKCMKLFCISILIAFLLIGFCYSNKHSQGERSAYYDHKMYERTLIEDDNKVPKNYTILYKYFSAHFKPVAYIEIDVDHESSGYIHESRGTQRHKLLRNTVESISIYDAKIHINNALKVTATLTIYGQGMMSMPSMGKFSGGLESSQSLTYVHVKNAFPTQKSYAQNSIGKRRTGDQLLHFESRNVTNVNRFPSRSFEYSGGEYITFVGFSFNSPTAMVMINTSFVGETEFNAVAYDINTEHFVANMSVYGIKTSLRPDKFLGVI